MSDTVQASGPAPVAQPGHSDLGMSPLLRSFLVFLGVGLGGLLFLVLAGTTSQGGAILALVLFIPWLVFTGLFGISLLATLLGSRALNYSRTKAAVSEGRIGISYYVRSWAGDNIIVVDEARRLLCVNGEILGFDAVRKVGWESGNTTAKLEIVLVSGANPIRSVDLHSDTRMKAAFERLCNTLGFSS